MAQSNQCTSPTAIGTVREVADSNEADERSERETVESANNIVEYPNTTFFVLGILRLTGRPGAILKHLLK